MEAHMTMRSDRFAQILTGCVAAAAMTGPQVALAEPAEVVYGIAAQAPTSAKSLVPGGLPGFPNARFTNFNNKIYRSPSTNQWLVVATTDATPATADQVFIVGSGTTASVRGQEGVTEFAPGMFLNFSRLDVPRINDAGQWAMGFRLGITGATTSDEKLVRWNGASFDLLGTANGPVGAQPGVTWFGAFNSANITSAGRVSFLGVVNPGISTTDSAFMNEGDILVAEVNVSVPSNQSPDSGNAQWADIDANEFFVSDDGQHWIAQGEVGLNTAADKVAVLDGAVVLQKGVVIAGSAFTSPVNTISDVWMESNGDWFARGANADGIDWVVRNGAVIAAEGQPVVPGSSMSWESFRSMRGNNRGDYIVNGNATGDTLSDDVIVFNGQRIVAREAAPVDLDGNGAFDDGLYLHLIQEHCTLNNDGYVLFASRLKNDPAATAGANGSNNASLIRVRACRADFNGSGSTTVQDIFDFLAAYFGNSPTADVNLSGAISVQDVFDFLAAYFSGC